MGGLNGSNYGPNTTGWIDPLGLGKKKTECEGVLVDGRYETLYRSMSPRHFAEFLRTGRMPGTKETFTSPTMSFSQSYRGIMVRFQLAPGTMDKLRSIGVRSHGRRTAEALADLPVVRRRWGRRNAQFKQEGDQINIGLGTGRALDTFNEGIVGYEVVGVNP
jgi:hypothetical protein